MIPTWPHYIFQFKQIYSIVGVKSLSLFATVQCECNDLENETDKYFLKSSSDTMIEWPSHYFRMGQVQCRPKAPSPVVWLALKSSWLIKWLISCLLVFCFNAYWPYVLCLKDIIQGQRDKICNYGPEIFLLSFMI